MLVGYNTNVTFKGKVYHVQTEDSGIRNPIIVTLLYIRGTILSSKKMSYAHIAANPDYKEKVRELMKEQHKNMIKELVSGKHTGGISAPAVPEIQEQAAEPVQKAPEQPPGKPDEWPAAQLQPSSEDKPEKDKGEGKAQIDKSLDDILLDYIMKRDG